MDFRRSPRRHEICLLPEVQASVVLSMGKENEGEILTVSTEKGMIALSTYLTQYRVGDIVDIKVNGAVQKGLVNPP